MATKQTETFIANYKRDHSTLDPDAALGEVLIQILGLPVIRSGPEKGRVRTTWGTKTPLGLALTVKRIINEAEDKR